MYLPELGEQIKKLRTCKKMTLCVFADRLGVNTSTVAAYENGTRNPSYQVLFKIARIFNVTIDYLLGNTSNDLIDITDLTDSQRADIQNQITAFKKLNFLLDNNFCSAPKEEFIEMDYEIFKERVTKKT